MKKSLIISGLIAWGVSQSLAASVLCTGFEKEGPPAHINAGRGTASYEIVEAGADEIIPEGTRYLKVTLSNTVKTNSFTPYINIQIPTNKIPDTATKLTMWIKGSPQNKFGPTLNMGQWCWNGLSWQNARAMFDVSEEGWVKHEFNVKDFVWRRWATNKESPPGPMRINEHVNFWLNFSEKSFTESITFCIDDIEVE